MWGSLQKKWYPVVSKDVEYFVAFVKKYFDFRYWKSYGFKWLIKQIYVSQKLNQNFYNKTFRTSSQNYKIQLHIIIK